MDGVRVGKVIVRVDVWLGQHLAAVAGNAGPADRNLSGDGLVDVRVDHGQREQFGIGG